MPFLEPVDTNKLKQYPYFYNWLKELGRTPEEVVDYAISSHVTEILSNDAYKRFAPTGEFTATLVFDDGVFFDRDGKFSDGTMLFLPEEEVKSV